MAESRIHEAVADAFEGIPIPTDVHPKVDAIAAETMDWASSSGLAADERGMARLRVARFHRVAARMFPTDPVPDVTLFTQWTVWFFTLDDQQDESAITPEDVRAVYNGLLEVLRQAKTPETTGERALADLWERTATRMSARWRQRFVHHLERHRDAFLTQADYRATGRVPTLAEYPDLRRRANGEHMFDLFEVVRDAEVPDALMRTATWQELFAAANDVTAWCNDILSVEREEHCGDTTNYVTVHSHALGCDRRTAITHVGTLLARRLLELDDLNKTAQSQARRPPADSHALRALRVAELLASLPGTHLAWMLESDRYQP